MFLEISIIICLQYRENGQVDSSGGVRVEEIPLFFSKKKV